MDIQKVVLENQIVIMKALLVLSETMNDPNLQTKIKDRIETTKAILLYTS